MVKSQVIFLVKVKSQGLFFKFDWGQIVVQDILVCHPLFHPGQLSFVLRSSTLPTPLNLHHWHIQTGTTCSLCHSPCPTCHHVLNDCPVALQQGRYTYHHDAVLSCLIAELLACLKVLLIWRANVCLIHLLPQFHLLYLYALISLMLYILEAVSLLELTCLFNSHVDLSAACERKQRKPEYLQVVSELDCLGQYCVPLKSVALAIILKRLLHQWSKLQRQSSYYPFPGNLPC